MLFEVSAYDRYFIFGSAASEMVRFEGSELVNLEEARTSHVSSRDKSRCLMLLGICFISNFKQQSLARIAASVIAWSAVRLPEPSKPRSHSIARKETELHDGSIGTLKQSYL